jgi:hypothetical protein
MRDERHQGGERSVQKGLTRASFVAQWEAGGGSVLSGRSVWLSVGGGLTLFVAVGQMV